MTATLYSNGVVCNTYSFLDDPRRGGVRARPKRRPRVRPKSKCAAEAASERERDRASERASRGLLHRPPSLSPRGEGRGASPFCCSSPVVFGGAELVSL